MKGLLSGALLFLLGCIVGVGAAWLVPGTVLRPGGETRGEEAENVTTLAAPRTNAGPEPLDDLDGELEKVVEVLSDVETGQRERLDSQDRVVALAERDGYETTVLFIIEKKYDRGQENSLLSAVFTRWAEKDGAAAADFAATLSRHQKNNMVSTVLTKWAGKSPGKAVAWLSERERSEFHSYLPNQVFQVIARKSADEAMRLREQFPDVFQTSQYSSYDSILATSIAAKD
ncbi:MAG: hypothetical protein MI807_14350, partial [Verrucomicrobiales bacterium]|nr:hypothetical protein [Verrucomicrobiales bacterium]